MTDTTVALRAVVGFHGLSANDLIHVHPDDQYYMNLVALGFLAYAYPEDDPAAQATVLNVDETGDVTTVLGVRPAPARGRRRRVEPIAESEAPDGEADPE